MNRENATTYNVTGEGDFIEFIVYVDDSVSFEFEVDEVLSWQDTEVSEVELLLTGYIKVDGCSHWNFGDKGYLHICGLSHMKRIAKAIDTVWSVAATKNEDILKS